MVEPGPCGSVDSAATAGAGPGPGWASAGRGVAASPVTAWMHPDLLIPTPHYRAPGRYGYWTRSPYALGGMIIVGVAVAATLAVCLMTALLALVAWMSAHAVAVGAGITAVAATALAFLLALARTCRLRTVRASLSRTQPLHIFDRALVSRASRPARSRSGSERWPDTAAVRPGRVGPA